MIMYTWINNDDCIEMCEKNCDGYTRKYEIIGPTVSYHIMNDVFNNSGACLSDTF